MLSTFHGCNAGQTLEGRDAFVQRPNADDHMIQLRTRALTRTHHQSA
jgi:hypothetical protein